MHNNGVRVNLLIDGPQGVIPGYVNVDPMATRGVIDPHGRVNGDPADLSPLFDRGEVDELLALDVLDYVPVAKAGPMLAHWASLLARGGTLTVSTLDPQEVARGLFTRAIRPEEATALLYGSQDTPWRFRQGAFTVGQLAAACEGLGLHVLKKRVSEYRAVVVAGRP